MNASTQSLQFFWGMLFALLLMAAIMRREQLNNWLWFTTVPKIGAAGMLALGLVAMIVFMVNGFSAIGR